MAKTRNESGYLIYYEDLLFYEHWDEYLNLGKFRGYFLRVYL